MGKLGWKLGFRWVFPVGTMPVPFHPLILPLALLGIVGWTVWSVWQAIAGAGGLASSIMMLILGLGLGLLMSIPVLCWFVFALGGRLVQCVLFLAAMILIAVDCWQGQISIVWAVLPGAYVGLFVIQLLFGPIWLRRIERERAHFGPREIGQQVTALAVNSHGARDLITGSAIASLYCPPFRGTNKGKHYHWLTAEDAQALQHACGQSQPRRWKFEPFDQAVLLTREEAQKPREAIWLSQGKLVTPLWLVTNLMAISARGCGQSWRLVHGEAGTIAPIPLMNLLRFTSISGSHYNQLIAGFPRRKAAVLEKPEVLNSREFTLLFAPREGGAGPFDKAGLKALHAEIAEHLRELAAERDEAIANIPAFWERLAQGQALRLLDKQSVDVLCKEPERLSNEQVTPVLDWFEAARKELDPMQLLSAARLLLAFDDDLLAPHRERLEAIFNSQSLALQWDIHKVVDRKPLPRNLPVLAGTYGGFGLFLSHPSLYAKLGRISPRMAKVERLLEQRVKSGEAGLCTKPTMIVSRNGVYATGPLDPV
jgi:hypothetical protein